MLLSKAIAKKYVLRRSLPLGLTSLLCFFILGRFAPPPRLFSGEVLIRPGSFLMGSPKEEPGHRPDEAPQHRVTLSYPFAIKQHEVTQKQFLYVMGYNPARLTDCKNLKTNQLTENRCPVDSVTWHEALAYANQLSALRELPQCFDCRGKRSQLRCRIKRVYSGKNGKDYFNCRGYRLPSEAEWEYAARASTTTPFATGKCLSSRQANHDGSFYFKGCFESRFHKHSSAVMSFAPNPWGLYDMAGNLYEWVIDSALRQYTHQPITDPIFLRGSIKVRRGGSWASKTSFCRSAYRRRYSSHIRMSLNGFRVCRTLR